MTQRHNGGRPPQPRPAGDAITRIAELVTHCRQLEQRLYQQSQVHLHLLTVLTHQLGGEIRITKFDQGEIRGVELLMEKDAATGDLIYRTRKVEVPHDDVQS